MRHARTAESYAVCVQDHFGWNATTNEGISHGYQVTQLYDGLGSGFQGGGEYDKYTHTHHKHTHTTTNTHTHHKDTHTPQRTHTPHNDTHTHNKDTHTHDSRRIF